MSWNFVVILMMLILGSECGRLKFRCERKRKNNNNSTCRYEMIDKTPWSTNKEQPAPMPTWPGKRSVKFIKHRNKDGSDEFRLKITWKQETSKIKKFVIGYYLEIKSDETPGPGFKTRFYINNDKINKNMAYFTYDQFGNSRADRIYPRVGFSVIIHALPIYNDGSTFVNQPLEEHVTSPACPNITELKKHPMRVCQTKEFTTASYYDYTSYSDENYAEYKDAEYSTDYYGDANDETTAKIDPGPEPVGAAEKKIFRIDIILLCTSFASLFCLLIYIYHKWDILKSKVKLCANSGYQSGIPLVTSSGRILVLVQTAGVIGRPPEWEFTQHFATSLNNIIHDDVIGCGKVECNLWNMSRSSCDPRSWLCEVITKSDFSRLVMVNNGSGSSDDDVRNDAYWAAVDYIRSGGHLRCNTFKLTTVNFSDDDVIAMDCDFVKAQNRISDVAHRRMPDDVDALMHELTGHVPDDVISTKLRQLATKVVELRTSTV